MKAVLLALLVATAFAAVPVFSPCDNNADYVYQIDFKNLYTEPKDVEKGVSAKLFIDGIMTAAEDVRELELDVNWSGVFLHKVEQPESDNVSKNQEYKITFGVNIPSFAPSGQYDLVGYVQGSPDGTTKTNLGCFKCSFTM